MSPDELPEVLLESRFLRLMRSGCWEYVQRTNSRAAVIVIPFTKDGKVVLIDQYRIPLQASVIELPAGMVGDDPGTENENLLAAAQRELLEETGYESADIREVFTLACSAGMTDEMATFFVAKDLRKAHAGGGIGPEEITVLEVPLASVDSWLAMQAATGKIIDAKLFTGLYFLRRELENSTK